MTETPPHELRTLRGVPAPVERALGAALSRGPGYEPTPIGTVFDATSVRGYYIDFRAKTDAATAADPAALPPGQLIQLALGWWEHHVHGDEAALGRFLELLPAIEARGERAADGLRWPFQVTVAKYGLQPGWCSALCQGQGGSVFVRAHQATGEDRYGQLAREALGPLLHDGDNDLVATLPAGPVLQEAPSTPRSHILNGWMSALWGLWDASAGLGDERAREVFEASVDALVAMLPAYDVGWWSRYGLFPHPIADLAKPIYHRFHVTQLRVFHRLTGRAAFAETADRWASYDRALPRARALAHKAVFAAVDGRRRRRWAASTSHVRDSQLPRGGS